MGSCDKAGKAGRQAEHSLIGEKCLQSYFAHPRVCVCVLGWGVRHEGFRCFYARYMQLMHLCLLPSPPSIACFPAKTINTTWAAGWPPLPEAPGQGHQQKAA